MKCWGLSLLPDYALLAYGTFRPQPAGERMDTTFEELTALGDLARTASLAPEAKQVTLYCMDQLPKLYEHFRRTNESRFCEELTSLSNTIVKRLAEPNAGADATHVSCALVACLSELHERFGLAPVRYKGAAPLPANRKRAK
jgi:hypothetical protein